MWWPFPVTSPGEGDDEPRGRRLWIAAPAAVRRSPPNITPDFQVDATRGHHYASTALMDPMTKAFDAELRRQGRQPLRVTA